METVGTLFWSNNNGETTASIHNADAVVGLRSLPDKSVHCCITSPPYFGLRSYLPEGHEFKPLEIGTEENPEEYIASMVKVFREVKRVLRDDGTLWVVIGDSYAGSGRGPKGKTAIIDHEKRMGFHSPKVRSIVGAKAKDLVGIPWMFAFAMRDDGWYLRKDIIWSKLDPTPESVDDRPTSAHEYIFLFSKKPTYYYDKESIREPIKPGTDGSVVAPSKHQSHKDSDTGYVQRKVKYKEIKGANRRSVWTVATGNFSGAHFATFPIELVSICLRAGTSEHGCCPVCGAPWQRIVRVEGKSSAEYMKGKDKSRFMSEQGQKQNLRAKADAFNRVRKLLGWKPACKCLVDGEIPKPVPCTALDPFLGAGTVVMVAQRMGRNGIGIELYEKFCEMSKTRIGQQFKIDMGKIIVLPVETDEDELEEGQVSFGWEDVKSQQ